MIDLFQCVDAGTFRHQALLELLTKTAYPARNPQQNIIDIQAQIAANYQGVKELRKLVKQYGRDVVLSYMQHVQDNAEECVREVIGRIHEGEYRYGFDFGAAVQVKIQIDRKRREAVIDFNGTSPQQTNNFNAPKAVCMAAVLYVFRLLVNEAVPLNEGCLKPLKVIIPENSLLDPKYPAAIVAGNVETSQCIVDALLGALQVMAAAQGTMNNLTFGNDQYQYYETICGGSGAGKGHDGASAVHTHMTNTRITDPEVLELRYPVYLREFKIRSNSGGYGRWTGGDGVVRKIEFRENMTVAVVSNRRKVPPYGMAGGAPGEVGKNWVRWRDGREENLSGVVELQVGPGDLLAIETPGGGGYGGINYRNNDDTHFDNNNGVNGNSSDNVDYNSNYSKDSGGSHSGLPNSYIHSRHYNSNLTISLLLTERLPPLQF